MKTKSDWMQKTAVVWAGALICCALWGSAFPCIKIGYELFEIHSEEVAAQILFAGCRFLLAGVLALAIGSLLNRCVLIPKKDAWPKVIKLSMLQTVVQYLFFYIGLAHTTGVKASILEGVSVFFAIFIASVIFHQESLSRQKILGSAIGFVGVVLVNLAGSSLSVSFTFLGEGLILLSNVAYGFSSVLMKRYAKQENPVTLSGWQFIAGGFILIGVGLLAGGRLNEWRAEGIGILFYMAFISAAAYSIWGILLKYNPVSKVAVFGFMTPVFGVLLSAVLLDEAQTIGMTCLAALALVCAGIYIVNREKA